MLNLKLMLPQEVQNLHLQVDSHMALEEMDQLVQVANPLFGQGSDDGT
jgi:hypothetical protein